MNAVDLAGCALLPMKKTKFLFIRFSSIGDIVLTSPLVRCLKQQVEEAEIHFVTKHKYRELLIGNPNISKIHYLNDHFGLLLKELKEENFDYVIDLHHNLRSFRIKRSLGIPACSFHKLNLWKWLLVNLKWDLLPDQHIVDRYFNTLSRFHVIPDGWGLDYFIPAGEEYDISRLPERYRQGYVAVIISGTYATKQLPASRVAEICESISYPMILVGGNCETPMSREIDRLVGDHVLNLAGKTTISESASLVRDARLVLTNDTGMMHIAAAFRKKILSFWGNTVPKFGMYPYKPHPASRIMEVKGLPCRPCSKLGYASCPKKHLRCMNDQDIAGAVTWIRENYQE
ncbi:MAG: glycosyltransferase family 9 protein [Prolixibacteraceae bacterium]|jgi:ADP-heptose:LPS heptosyltransferase|nr:glycosyltransferase family 9 protein [Prolixibacteraceae bacterium]OQB82143.1 MAG: ADP-heptose--LPS heptosyltransferase 2 [Bacteroidetes bacterium ADurb.Bin123]HNZ70139.1 glycosyltransferase family 9 protein [Prolixibacteraceae bacterium]HOC87226.1 glycosyltransferase family 9 protein [Prolixibacteraceae bacterium]HOG97002.1 glycosyltransferase family 9 protein [Prolixibacteraceae bacterium]